MIDLNQLKESVLKADGYGQGFKDGYASCAKFVVEELEKQEKEKELVKE